MDRAQLHGIFKELHIAMLLIEIAPCFPRFNGSREPVSRDSILLWGIRKPIRTGHLYLGRLERFRVNVGVAWTGCPVLDEPCKVFPYCRIHIIIQTVRQRPRP
jgi:hypothetical protein